MGTGSSLIAAVTDGKIEVCFVRYIFPVEFCYYVYPRGYCDNYENSMRVIVPHRQKMPLIDLALMFHFSRRLSKKFSTKAPIQTAADMRRSTKTFLLTPFNLVFAGSNVDSLFSAVLEYKFTTVAISGHNMLLRCIICRLATQHSSSQLQTAI